MSKIQDPIGLCAVKGLENTIKLLETEGYSEGEIIKITSEYLDQKGFAGPMVIGIGSAKGGTGKSTVATNLVQAFGRLGLRSGLVDADIIDPNDALRVYKDTKVLTSEDGLTVDFNHNGCVLDVVIGVKEKGQRSIKRKSLTEIGIPSIRRPHVTYFLSQQLGDSQEGRGDKRQREKSLREAEEILLREARSLKDYQIIVLDFSAGTPEYLDAYIGCDGRGYVVDFTDHASFAGIENIAKLVAKKQIDGNNFMIINKIPQVKRREEIRDRINWISAGLDKIAVRLGMNEDQNTRDARKLVSGHNAKLKELGLERLAFYPEPALLALREDVRDSSNLGTSYLAWLTQKEERTNGYSNQMFRLAVNMMNLYLQKNRGEVR